MVIEMTKEMSNTKIGRALSGACVATSLLMVMMSPDSAVPMVNALSGALFMAAAFVFWSD